VNVILFGATGMVGQGVLRECLLAPDVESVLVIGRGPTGKQHPKLREIIQKDLADLSPIASQLSGYDACFFCLGVSAAGMTEAAYRRVTYDLTLAAAELLVNRNPSMTFVYVSGAGTNANGRAMWARVKGETENALLRLPFKGAYMFRPGYIQPMHGAVSKTKLYRAVYAVMGGLYPVFKALAPNAVLTTEQVGRAMLHVARHGAPMSVLESRDINAVL
jgi:uncharacterized protein YbjT (DUF2867 family)